MGSIPLIPIVERKALNGPCVSACKESSVCPEQLESSVAVKTRNDVGDDLVGGKGLHCSHGDFPDACDEFKHIKSSISPTLLSEISKDSVQLSTSFS